MTQNERNKIQLDKILLSENQSFSNFIREKIKSQLSMVKKNTEVQYNVR